MGTAGNKEFYRVHLQEVPGSAPSAVILEAKHVSCTSKPMLPPYILVTLYLSGTRGTIAGPS